MTEFDLPNYYNTDISFHKEDGKYFMLMTEHLIAKCVKCKTEISKEFYEAACKEFSTEKEWIEIERRMIK